MLWMQAGKATMHLHFHHTALRQSNRALYTVTIVASPNAERRCTFWHLACHVA